MKPQCQNKVNEKGAVLVIALIFLLILSLIGVSSMQGTTMQEKMSGNLRDHYSAFNAAEAALRDGERQARTDYFNDTLDEDTSINGVYASSFSSAAIPTWNAELLAEIYVSTGIDAEPSGAVIRVTASSAGFTGQSDVRLESIYVVEE
ncbi:MULTISPECIES: PilX N-terminal domain-containing pilus assembly protein [Neptuniibacter]|jgi:type IV pilus assembly protein PilX|uniref:pilus assembly PilX family protein n=1 Tax=Neptuniibacter TaxID=459520 RepID=UPI000834BB55|nr:MULTISPECIES: PilX N-terminal domain-containing pilus assembly protein [Neptuniibacter]MDO6513885.1 PilX N-terminal domain-containing pilus assembly protein [Neptuniibacter sp. 2_MG-2023]MDO6593156.1 PilX N-terminal domain-containing pilus assembly protein [Neptuniibacter sp. 1_MG-2023]